MKIIIALLVAALICFFGIPYIIQFLYCPNWPIDIFQVDWEASDALGYTAGVLSFLGTMFLGWVSWKQNQTLQKKQDDTFIAENSCMVLINKVEFKNMTHKAVNLNIHPETIVVTNLAKKVKSPLYYRSFECIIELKHTNKYPVVVRVIEATLQAQKERLKFERYDDCFTRIEISKNMSRFQLTFITSQNEMDKIGPIILNKCKSIFLNIRLEVVTDKYVSTILICRNTLRLKEETDDAIYISDPKEAVSFWYGNSILSSESIQYRRETQEESENGQTENGNA